MVILWFEVQVRHVLVRRRRPRATVWVAVLFTAVFHWTCSHPIWKFAEDSGPTEMNSGISRGLVLNLMKFVSEMRKFVLNMMNFELEMKKSVLKMRKYVLKMREFVFKLLRDLQRHAGGAPGLRWICKFNYLCWFSIDFHRFTTDLVYFDSGAGERHRHIRHFRSDRVRSLKNGDFPLKDDDVISTNDEFLLRNGNFPSKNDDLPLKMMMLYNIYRSI